MPNDSFSAQVEYTAEFKRNLRVLAKKYPHIRSDVQPLLHDLELGDTPGDHIPGVGYTVFKVRLRNRDTQKGKRSGYRLIYYLKTPKATFPRGESRRLSGSMSKLVYESGSLHEFLSATD